jgi:uncharacterized protein YndB with AHSA1/START domain
MRARAYRRTDLPAAQLWGVLADHAGMTTWFPGLTVGLDHCGQPPPNGVGAIRLVRMLGLTVREEITAFQPPHRLAYRCVSRLPLRNYAGEVILTPRGAVTEVTWVLSCDNRFFLVQPLLSCTTRIFLAAFLAAARRRGIGSPNPGS